MPLRRTAKLRVRRTAMTISFTWDGSRLCPTPGPRLCFPGGNFPWSLLRRFSWLFRGERDPGMVLSRVSESFEKGLHDVCLCLLPVSAFLLPASLVSACYVPAGGAPSCLGSAFVPFCSSICLLGTGSCLLSALLCQCLLGAGSCLLSAQFRLHPSCGRGRCWNRSAKRVVVEFC